MGATVSSNTSLDIARQQQSKADDQKAREQKETTYREYLDAAVGYRAAASDLFARTAPSDVSGAFSAFMTARSRFQKQANEVYVYGSDDAWKAHVDVAGTLPPALSDAPLNFKASDLSNETAFTAAYQEFLAVRCREVAAKARTGCGG
ncbi:hypothetical protein [Paenarthrobacter sp. NPDC090522]|uniref:hypothetical protein n=1 Tax=Paenarthrobacter sp. NPDC090522 TaxID=3364383 RepID=UPI0038043A06